MKVKNTYQGEKGLKTTDSLSPTPKKEFSMERKVGGDT